jgi:hypothetical protein
VRDDEVGVVHLQVERHRREHHAGQAADDEDAKKPSTNSIGVFSAAARPDRRDPAEDLVPSGSRSSCSRR